MYDILVASALKKVANIDRRYEKGDIEEKRLIVSSIFPDYLEFDGVQHRTRRLNSAIALIYQNYNKLQGKNKGTSLPFLDLSLEVDPERFELSSSHGTVYAFYMLSFRFIVGKGKAGCLPIPFSVVALSRRPAATPGQPAP